LLRRLRGISLTGWRAGCCMDGRATDAANAGGPVVDCGVVRHRGGRRGSGMGHCSEWFPHLLQVSNQLYSLIICRCNASSLQDVIFLLHNEYCTRETQHITNIVRE